MSLVFLVLMLSLAATAAVNAQSPITAEQKMKLHKFDPRDIFFDAQDNANDREEKRRTPAAKPPGQASETTQTALRGSPPGKPQRPRRPPRSRLR
jgi:hypothetical protein